MTKTFLRNGLIAAAVMNIGGVLAFSKFFTNAAVNEADPVVMSNFGLVMIVVWGLAYAGAASILTTLWRVNDERSAVFMEKFYTHLGKGHARDEALQMAKMELLVSSDDFHAHPYYWAGYIAVGDMQPLYPGTRWWMWALLPGLGLIPLLAVGVLRKKATRQRLS